VRPIGCGKKWCDCGGVGGTILFVFTYVIGRNENWDETLVVFEIRKEIVGCHEVDEWPPLVAKMVTNREKAEAMSDIKQPEELDPWLVAEQDW
jgi:hypothetical protein